MTFTIRMYIPYSAIALIAWCSLASNDPGSAPGAKPVGDPVAQKSIIN